MQKNYFIDTEACEKSKWKLKLAGITNHGDSINFRNN